MPKAYKQKFHAEYWSSDIKPKGKIRRKVEGSNRMRAKQSIKNEVDAVEDLTMEMLNEEAELAMYCHMYGPCPKCLER